MKCQIWLNKQKNFTQVAENCYFEKVHAQMLLKINTNMGIVEKKRYIEALQNIADSKYANIQAVLNFNIRYHSKK